LTERKIPERKFLAQENIRRAAIQQAGCKSVTVFNGFALAIFQAEAKLVLQAGTGQVPLQVQLQTLNLLVKAEKPVDFPTKKPLHQGHILPWIYKKGDKHHSVYRLACYCAF
jgi:hypothetical protein